MCLKPVLYVWTLYWTVAEVLARGWYVQAYTMHHMTLKPVMVCCPLGNLLWCAAHLKSVLMCFA